MRSLIERALIGVAAVLVVLALRPAYELGVGFNLWQPFTRPRGVPAQARYVSVLEDSAWFDCSFERAKDVDICKAWDDAGHVIAYGKSGRPELSWID